MATLALLGVLIVAPPLGLDNATLNDLVPENGVALLTATANVFEVASPSAHCRMPLAVEKSFPATAVPLVVTSAALTVPLDPPVRLTVTVTVPALWLTA